MTSDIKIREMQNNHNKILFAPNRLAKIKVCQYQVSIRMWSKWNSHTLLMIV